MNNNRKLFLVNIIPLLLVLVGIYYLNSHQHERLTEQASQVYREGLINTRRSELKSLVESARGAIKSSYENDTISETEAQNQVKSILRNMRFGDDGYYFAYDYDGINIVLPGQEWREGENMISLEDVNGTKIVQGLIENGRNGGGYINYIFNQPSRDLEPGNKLSYSESLDRWGWIFGTGVYIDDINEQANQLEDSLASYINSAAKFTITLGVFSIFVVFASGTYRRVNENRLANQKLVALNERIFQTQEEERKRVARELHDGVSQMIASAKFSLESVQLKHANDVDVEDDLGRVKSVITQVMNEVRAISHRLHPGLLEDHGLGAALEDLGRAYQHRTGTTVSVKRLSVNNILSMDIKSNLYRIAQEALTNVERHSNATEIELKMELSGKWLLLEVADNGQGFDLKNSERHSDGIGLRNMKERIGHFNGELKISTSSSGTIVQARVPNSFLNYSSESRNDDSRNLFKDAS